MHTYFVYILTNQQKKVLYTGITNNLAVRLHQHKEESKKAYTKSFAGKYQCYWLVFYEVYADPVTAIAREKEIKKWGRIKKEAQIESFNPGWRFLNETL